jgi:hypothetical protein
MKHKLKVKSLVFTNSQVVCAREAINSIQASKNYRINTESYEHDSKPGNKGDLSSKLNKGILPTIHNSLAARNKRCL